jgi:hypothetical protein
MTYFARYRDGDHQGVWDELVRMGAHVHDPSVLCDARSVAHATMDIVAGNIERLIARLASHGYDFQIYPDGTELLPALYALIRPDAQTLADIRELEGLAGAIPLSLLAFWEVVGSVSLIGCCGDGWPDYSDPLYVEAPRGGVVDFRDWHGDGTYDPAPGDTFLCPIAPDVLHKDNVSGGSPYSIRLPNAGADALLCNEWHNVGFIAYLRIAILDWGGFPGLSQANPQDKWRTSSVNTRPEWFNDLTRDLTPF